MNHLKSLEKMGLNNKEQEIYITLLQLEKATANQIAERSKQKRPTTYDILYRLQDQGFIYETKENNKRYFIANSPETLLKLVEDQKRNLEADLPALLSIYNTNPKKPKIAYFEWYEGIKLLYEDTLSTLKKGDEIMACATNETIEYLESYSANYVQRRIQKGIHLKGIYQDTPDLRKYLEHNDDQLRTSKVVKAEKFPLKNEINIYGNKIIIITYSPQPYGILIESKEIADTQRAIFNLAWNSIKD